MSVDKNIETWLTENLNYNLRNLGDIFEVPRLNFSLSCFGLIEFYSSLKSGQFLALENDCEQIIQIEHLSMIVVLQQ